MSNGPPGARLTVARQGATGPRRGRSPPATSHVARRSTSFRPVVRTPGHGKEAARAHVFASQRPQPGAPQEPGQAPAAPGARGLGRGPRARARVPPAPVLGGAAGPGARRVLPGRRPARRGAALRLLELEPPAPAPRGRRALQPRAAPPARRAARSRRRRARRRAPAPGLPDLRRRRPGPLAPGRRAAGCAPRAGRPQHPHRRGDGRRGGRRAPAGRRPRGGAHRGRPAPVGAAALRRLLAAGARRGPSSRRWRSRRCCCGMAPTRTPATCGKGCRRPSRR